MKLWCRTPQSLSVVAPPKAVGEVPKLALREARALKTKRVVEWASKCLDKAGHGVVQRPPAGNRDKDASRTAHRGRRGVAHSHRCDGVTALRVGREANLHRGEPRVAARGR